MLLSILHASAALALLHIFHTASAATPTTSAAASTTSLVLNAMTAKGCYSSSADMVSQGTWTWQTSGYCQPICVGLGMPVMGLSNGTTCWCGSQLPPASDKVSDSSCNVPCDGYPDDKCGGANAWTVLLSGITSNVGTQNDLGPAGGATTSNVATSKASSTTITTATTTPPSSASSPTTTSIAPVTVTVGGSTIVRTMAVTAVASPTSTSASTAPPSHSSSKAGIAAGVVVGLIALGAIIGGVVFYLRRRRSQAATTPSGHRRNTSLNAFAPPPPPSSVPRPLTVNMNDSRLDPGIMQEKRQSGVSIFADNFDYSRRILKVSNPDRP